MDTMDEQTRNTYVEDANNLRAEVRNLKNISAELLQHNTNFLLRVTKVIIASGGEMLDEDESAGLIEAAIYMLEEEAAKGKL